MPNSTYSGLTLLGIPQSTYEWVAGQTTNQKLKRLHEAYGDKLVKIEEGLFLLLKSEVFISSNQHNITDTETIRAAARPYLNALGKKGYNMVISTPTHTPEKMKLCFEGNVDEILEDDSIKLLSTSGIPDSYYQHPQKVPITFIKHKHGFVGLIKTDLLKNEFGINFKPFQGSTLVNITVSPTTESDIGFYDPDHLVIPNNFEALVSLEKYAGLAKKKPAPTSSHVESEIFLKKDAKGSPAKPESIDKSKTDKSQLNTTAVPIESKKSRQLALAWLLAAMALVAVVWLWNPQATSASSLDRAAPVYSHIANSFKDPNLELIVFDGKRNTDWTPIKRNFNGTMMVLVPAGSFSMGSSTEQIDSALLLCSAARSSGNCQRLLFEDEEPTNVQNFTSPFWLDETEVTRIAYDSCVSAGACTPVLDNQYSKATNQPINNVTWYQASAYCSWRGARLPTEAEWEYAARGPDGLEYPWGNTMVGNESNHCDSNCAQTDWGKGLLYKNQSHDDAFAETAPVGSYPSGKSWVGALDMSGNVWEWTNSLYKEYPYNRTDGREVIEGEDSASEKVVLRGGSFVDYADYVRAADRYQVVPNVSLDYGGFRCAHSK